MDMSQSQTRQQSCSRAQSQSSAQTSTSHVAPTGASNSSQTAASPQRPQSCSSRRHRAHGSTGSPGPMSRSTPPLSRKESNDSAHQPALSSFLQEKLQRERKAESERLNQSRSSLPREHSNMSTSAELGRAPSSPFRTSISETSRPQSGVGMEQAKKKGFGLKEMEKVLSSLHKQNFDLKLELYHRRDRQTTLEERLDALEKDKQQLEEVNDKLLVECEKRDKAVEEAVAMIVTLEAKVDQLLRERMMVQQMERESIFGSRDDLTSITTPVPQGLGPDVAKLEEDARSVHRMPSFVSDRSQTTENLRNVYLETRASTTSLPRVVESSPETDKMQTLGSPSLSMLSESSFVSIYGEPEEDRCEDVHHSPVPGDQHSTLSDSPAGAEASHTKSCLGPFSTTTGHESVSGGRFRSIPDVNAGLSQQQLGRVDTSLTNRWEPAAQNQVRQNPKFQSTPESRAAGPKGLRQDKQDGLRRALTTNGPGALRFHDQGFPPTPDTTSSSTLCHMQGLDETVSQEYDASHDRGNGDSPTAHSTTACGGKLTRVRKEAFPEGPRREFDSWAARSSRSPVDLQFEQRPHLGARPRSADESTISYRSLRTCSRPNDVDGSDDGSSDGYSFRSSLDIWMREGTQTLNDGRRESPDMLNFSSVTPKMDWAADSSSGPHQISKDKASMPPGFDYMRDLFSLREGLLSHTPPPPPMRRSSLHARTGSSNATSPGGQGQAREHRRSSSTKRWSYQASQNSVESSRRDDSRNSEQGNPSTTTSPNRRDQKSKDYPPLSRSQNGARSGLNRLFRRSTSGGPRPYGSESDKQGEAASPATAQSQTAMGVPSWENRTCAPEDDRSGATPPPIVLQGRQARRSTLGAEDESERPSAQDIVPGQPLSPAAAMEMAVEMVAQKETRDDENGLVPPPATGMRRKWLHGFSRSGSSKNKSG